MNQNTPSLLPLIPPLLSGGPLPPRHRRPAPPRAAITRGRRESTPPLVVLGSFITTVDGSNAVQFAISAEVREGEIKAMLGASGAGKSTLIDMLSGWI
ncbi:hypothetical protein GQ55_1G372100 [Panicum hallii var. hallii]|uniref:ABC transporter domain-containing protein n=1 Tax=Panicum hallii var. hallii TaxID=1504633 RepID=A0A2T7FBK7_9POAL|nr:hypothetical protein GQ55_1G372100 [Panicum hallii var. hallii]